MFQLNFFRAIAPKHLLEPLKRVHEPSVFMCCTPTQEALARVYEVPIISFHYYLTQ